MVSSDLAELRAVVAVGLGPQRALGEVPRDLTLKDELDGMAWVTSQSVANDFVKTLRPFRDKKVANPGDRRIGLSLGNRRVVASIAAVKGGGMLGLILSDGWVPLDPRAREFFCKQFGWDTR